MGSDTPRPPHLAQLTDRLWTGGALPYREDAAIQVISAWRQLGIGAIVDCRAEWSDDILLDTVAPDIAYANPGVVDGGQHMEDNWFEAITSFAHVHLANGTGVLVHCHSGINRGPSGAFAVLLTLGWDPVDAIELIRNARPAARVAYAEDAIDWWHRTSEAEEAVQHSERERFTEWRRHNQESSTA